ncbi:hypothetical protein [Rubrivivax gelatinosus]|uniref:hypothetical protein n=1 Tax=Rubrivivax gelatinosus TaxID=28068 RepID=UPI001906BCE2|nr:hypothetical protein [Rubrivivax gelatinosus]MBK1686513.1 hypothetical protein [Rubrivivax gelatinosus]
MLLDTSGSMRRGGRLARAKGVAAWLVAQAARHGDHLGLLAFGGGRCPGEPPAPRAAAQVVIVDHDDGPVTIGRCAAWAERWGARCVPAQGFNGERR